MLICGETEVYGLMISRDLANTTARLLIFLNIAHKQTNCETRKPLSVSNLLLAEFISTV